MGTGRRTVNELAEEYSRRINHDYLALPDDEKREFAKLMKEHLLQLALVVDAPERPQ